MIPAEPISLKISNMELYFFTGGMQYDQKDIEDQWC